MRNDFRPLLYALNRRPIMAALPKEKRGHFTLNRVRTQICPARGVVGILGALHYAARANRAAWEMHAAKEAARVIGVAKQSAAEVDA